jgi:hypothetical protein
LFRFSQLQKYRQTTHSTEITNQLNFDSELALWRTYIILKFAAPVGYIAVNKFLNAKSKDRNDNIPLSGLVVK